MGAPGLTRAPLPLRPPPAAPAPPHTGCRASLGRKCMFAVRAGPARGGLAEAPAPRQARKQMPRRGAHQSNSHKTRCEAARRGRKHLLGLRGLRVVADRRSGGSHWALRGRYMAPGGPLHGALCGRRGLFVGTWELFSGRKRPARAGGEFFGHATNPILKTEWIFSSFFYFFLSNNGHIDISTRDK